MAVALPTSAAPTAFHARDPEEAARLLNTDLHRGLAPAEVDARLASLGPNALTAAPPPSWIVRFARQFRSVLIVVLLVAAAISAALGHAPDAAAIGAIVLLNAFIGLFHEERAGRAVAALQKLGAPNARVVRDGLLAVVPAASLVPGDLVELEAGDFIPADARLVTAFAFRTQEAALTGESLPVEKEAEALLDPESPLADRRNCVYRGTVAAAGRATAVVTATGMATEIGRISTFLQSQEAQLTPLQKRLAALGRALAAACLLLVAAIFALELLKGGEILPLFMTAVSLAVAAVPEGLPAVVTIALAIGVQRMIRRNALVRNLAGVETLGGVTVICTDKTGTLTRNEMTVQRIVAGGRSYDVTGTGYAPRGEFLEGGGPIDPARRPVLLQALEAALACNHARLVPTGEGGHWTAVGDPTEAALVVAAMKAGLDPQARPSILAEIPFDPSRKAMSVSVRDAGGRLTCFTKGALETVLAMCDRERVDGGERPLTAARRREILDAGHAAGEEAMRVLALACAPAPADPRAIEERGLAFLGFAGMLDPPRDEAGGAVRRCAEAGIRPVMITGDHPATAAAVGRRVGISGDVVTGPEIDAASDEALEARAETASVFARVTANQKLRIVRALRRRGHVVAMTGDGVNDATALKAADIGVAMGREGTDVAREASDMVLTDDNFATIVGAVEEGRTIYGNIRKILRFLLTANGSEILLILAASLAGWPLPLLPLQLLWINLVTDGLPAIALAMEPPEPGLMRRRPRALASSILSWRDGLWILWCGLLLAAASLGAFAAVYLPDPTAVERARTAAFCVVVFSQLLAALSMRSRTVTLLRLGLFTNTPLAAAVGFTALLHLGVVTLPFVMSVFSAAPHTAADWAVVAAFSVAPFLAIEASKAAGLLLAKRRVA